MPKPADGATRTRVLHVAGELFGRQGYRVTTIAQIEQAAGLSPGAGGLYRHFATKRAILEECLKRQVEGGPDLGVFLSPPTDPTDLTSQLRALAQAGLRRLEHERDLNRLLVRDLAEHPDLLALVRDHELRRVHQGLSRWLASITTSDVDVASVATVLMGAVSHYWIMTDVFDGTHPFQENEDAFLEVLADMAASALE